MKLKLPHLLMAAIITLVACNVDSDATETVDANVVSEKLQGKYQVTFVLDTAKLQGNTAADNLGVSMALAMLEMIKINVEFQPDNVAVFDVNAGQFMGTKAKNNKARGKWKIEDGKLRFYDFDEVEEQGAELPKAFKFDDFDGNYTQFDLISEDTTISDMVKAWRFTKVVEKKE